MGVDDYIVDYKWSGYRYTEDRVGHEGFVISYATSASGKVYPMIRWCKLSKTLEIIANILTYVFFVLGMAISNVLIFLNYEIITMISNRTLILSGKYIKYSDWKWQYNIGIECNIGYKNFNITQVPKFYKYSFTVSINPFKKFEPKVG